MITLVYKNNIEIDKTGKKASQYATNCTAASGGWSITRQRHRRVCTFQKEQSGYWATEVTLSDNAQEAPIFRGSPKTP